MDPTFQPTTSPPSTAQNRPPKTAPHPTSCEGWDRSMPQFFGKLPKNSRNLDIKKWHPLVGRMSHGLILMVKNLILQDLIMVKHWRIQIQTYPPSAPLFELGCGNSCKRRTFGITPQLRNANPKYRLQGCENTREWCLLRIPTNTKAISIPQIHGAMVKLVLLLMKCELATSGWFPNNKTRTKNERGNRSATASTPFFHQASNKAVDTPYLCFKQKCLTHWPNFRFQPALFFWVNFNNGLEKLDD